MELLSLSTDIVPMPARADSWRNFICRMIHSVSVENASPNDFAAQISARRHGNVSCASFWSKSHEIYGRRETFGSAGASGYLVSWQIEGEAQVTQEGRQFLLQLGEVAILDGRRPMTVRFPGEVRPVIANLPAKTVESRLPTLLRWHTLVTRPSGPFASILGSYLSALSSGQQTIEHNDVELLVENICNLLKITSGQQTSDASPRELQRESAIRYIRRHACKADLSLATVAGDLNMSRRLVQKLLQEMQSNFTEVLLSERLEIAARQLTASYNGQISAIAYFCGFNDVTHFNHAFKHRFGVTPSQMRSNGRQPG